MVTETCCVLCVANHSRCWSKPLRSWLPDVKKGENVKGTCDTDANRDLTRNSILTLKPCHVIQPSGSRTSLRDPCFFCLVHILWSFVTRSALVPLKSVAIPETVLTSLLLRHNRQLSSGFAHALFTVLQSCSRVCLVLYLSSPIPTTLST